MVKIFSALVCFLCLITKGYCLTFEKFNSELFSPFTTKKTQPILLTGTALTLTALAIRRPYLEKFEDRQYESQSLDSWAEVGDLVGQLIPNITYSLYNFTEGTPLGDKRAWGMVKATAYSGLTTSVLKYAIRAPRPGDNPERNSFPSGHSTTIFAFGGYVLEEHGWKPGLFALGLASFCGYSRIHDRMHRVHEVIAGATIGLSYGIAIAKKYKTSEVSTDSSFHFSPIFNMNEYGFMLVRNW